MPAIDLVVTDLDGTLWFGHEETHPVTIDAWRELERRDIPVLVATGRRVSSTRVPLARFGLAPPAVMLNGAISMHLATRARFHSHHYAPDDARAVLAAFREAGLDPCVYVDHEDVAVFVGERPSTHPDHMAGLGRDAQRADLDQVVVDFPVVMFGVLGHDRAPLLDVTRLVPPAFETHLAASDQYGDHSVTVTPAGLSKWTGVLAYCEQAGLDPARILAIGDGPNDRELLAAAAIAVAPVSGEPDVVRDADHVVGSPRDGGWAEILQLV